MTDWLMLLNALLGIANFAVFVITGSLISVVIACTLFALVIGHYFYWK